MRCLMWYELNRMRCNIVDTLFGMEYPFIKGIAPRATIAIVGNANSILNHKHGKEIDNHDVVVRSNKGYTRGKTECIGSRTDVLISAYNITNNKISDEYGYPYLIWAHYPSQTSNFWKDVAYQYPDTHRKELKRAMGSVFCQPSTGIIALDIVRRWNPKQIDLYGFDFHASGCWWNKRQDARPHNPALEKQYVMNLIKTEGNIKLI